MATSIGKGTKHVLEVFEHLDQHPKREGVTSYSLRTNDMPSYPRIRLQDDISHLQNTRDAIYLYLAIDCRG